MSTIGSVLNRGSTVYCVSLLSVIIRAGNISGIWFNFVLYLFLYTAFRAKIKRPHFFNIKVPYTTISLHAYIYPSEPSACKLHKPSIHPLYQPSAALSHTLCRSQHLRTCYTLQTFSIIYRKVFAFDHFLQREVYNNKPA